MKMPYFVSRFCKKIKAYDRVCFFNQRCEYLGYQTVEDFLAGDWKVYYNAIVDCWTFGDCENPDSRDVDITFIKC